MARNVTPKAMQDVVPMKSDQTWSIKKEISLPSMFAMFMQTAAVVWFVATLNNRVDQIQKQTDLYAPQTEKVIKIEAKMDALQDGLAEIKGILRNTPPMPRRPSVN